MSAELTDQASAKMQNAQSAVQEKASQVREEGSQRLRDQLQERSSRAGSQARSLAEALRHSGSELRGQGNTSAAQLTSQAADRMERVGRYLEQKDGDELMNDLDSFARRRPWLLAGFGLLAGVAAARFVKASSENRYGDFRRTNAVSGQAAGRRGKQPCSRRWCVWQPFCSASIRRPGVAEMAMRNETGNELRERPVGEVAKDLTSDLSLLMRQEIELAKAELVQKGRTAAIGLGLFAGAGVVALCAAGAVTGFLVLVCSLFLPDWAAALLVGVVLVAVACRAGLAGKGAGGRGREACSGTDHRDGEGGHRMGEDPSVIRAEIERTRQRVGEEVDALSYKTDVGARVEDYVDDKKEAVKSTLSRRQGHDDDTRAGSSGGQARRRATCASTAESNPLGLARRRRSQSASSSARCSRRRGSRTNRWARLSDRMIDAAKETASRGGRTRQGGRPEGGRLGGRDGQGVGTGTGRRADLDPEEPDAGAVIEQRVVPPLRRVHPMQTSGGVRQPNAPAGVLDGRWPVRGESGLLPSPGFLRNEIDGTAGRTRIGKLSFDFDLLGTASTTSARSTGSSA